jgi:hypothetical protein
MVSGAESSVPSLLVSIVHDVNQGCLLFGRYRARFWYSQYAGTSSPPLDEASVLEPPTGARIQLA